MADSIVRYSENYLRSCIGDAIYNETESDELMDYGIGNITLKKVVNTEDITKIKVSLTGEDLLSIYSEFVSVEGLEVKDIKINDWYL